MPDSNIDLAILALINAERAEYRLAPLGHHPALTAAAQAHSEDQARRDRLDHYGPDRNTTWADRIAAAGYPGATLFNCGENVAGGQADPEGVVADWMSSPGHRAAILHPVHRHCGSGMAQSASGMRWRYWTTDFCSGAPDVGPVPTPNPTPIPRPVPTPARSFWGAIWAFLGGLIGRS